MSPKRIRRALGRTVDRGQGDDSLKVEADGQGERWLEERVMPGRGNPTV